MFERVRKYLHPERQSHATAQLTGNMAMRYGCEVCPYAREVSVQGLGCIAIHTTESNQTLPFSISRQMKVLIESGDGAKTTLNFDEDGIVSVTSDCDPADCPNRERIQRVADDFEISPDRLALDMQPMYIIKDSGED